MVGFSFQMTLKPLQNDLQIPPSSREHPLKWPLNISGKVAVYAQMEIVVHLILVQKIGFWVIARYPTMRF